MIEVKITKEMYDKAKERADNEPLYKNSITKNEGRLAGFLGEEIFLSLYGGDIEDTYDFDILTNNGVKVDVKTKRTTAVPQPHYEASVRTKQKWQECDYYAFVRVDKTDYKRGWFLGVYPKAAFFEDAVYQQEGHFNPSNNFRSSAACYSIEHSKLMPLTALDSPEIQEEMLFDEP